VEVAAVKLESMRLLVLRQQRMTRAQVAASKVRRAARHAMDGSRKEPHPQAHPPPQPFRPGMPGTTLWGSMMQAVRRQLDRTRASAAAPSEALGAMQRCGLPCAAAYSLCSTSSSSGGALVCDVTCRTWTS
jgi:hypothetical protein